MTTELTLMLEAAIVKRARSYARQTGRSLSELVENYFKSLVEERKENSQLSSKLKSIAGAVKLPADFDEKKEIHNYLKNKHF